MLLGDLVSKRVKKYLFYCIHLFFEHRIISTIKMKHILVIETLNIDIEA